MTYHYQNQSCPEVVKLLDRDAINLVYGVTKRMIADGFVPILYTNADYIASNACYQKIGYRQIGRLTSICK